MKAPLCLLLLLGVVQAQLQRTMRVVTWNVADNEGMDGRFDEAAVRQVLGLERIGSQRVASYFDIYAITLQENCHLCNSNEFAKLTDIFVRALNQEGRFQYEAVGHSATRVSRICGSWACQVGMHGSTHMMVIAKRGMASLRDTFHTNKCMGGWMKNAEKGIASVKFQLRGFVGQDICVGGLHLDSAEADERRECFEKFNEEHSDRLRGCAQIFFAGDFNTRTGPKGGPTHSVGLNANEMARLRPLDELKGSQPFGGKALLAFINAAVDRHFKEGQLDFWPTYSVKPPTECDAQGQACYRGDRPPSWTDRIICSGCNVFWYGSLPIFKSDHMPVVGIYTL